MYQTSRSGWSDWIWNADYGQYYRQRVGSSGQPDIQWQSEFESAQKSQVPRTPVEQMTQQFGAVNIQSPEQTTGDEQNNDEYSVTGGASSRSKPRSSRPHSSSSKSKPKYAKPSGGKGKGPAHGDIDENDKQVSETAAPSAEQIYYDQATGQYFYSPAGQAAPSSNQTYTGGTGEQDDEELRAALAQSKQYARDTYRSGESSSAAYPPYVAHDEEKDPEPSAPLGNTEHIMGTGGDTEKLDPRYRVAHSQMFQPGEVFKVLWPEPAGGGSIVEETVYRDQYGGRIFVHFRRFIVVANDLGHCTCIPISTYGKKACKKTGVKAEQHGIVAESSSRNPVALPNEPELGFAPVRVHIYEPGERISKESRVNYSKLTTVEHNVKVLFIGRVVGSDWDIVTEAVNTSWANKTHTHKKKHRR